MRIHCVEHVEHETSGSIAEWATERGHTMTRTRLWAGEPLPDLDSFDWLVVMGGPMSVKDESEHPWLVKEKWLVVQAIAARRLVLGVCLGAQIIAEVLGADVTECPTAEIGWYPVRQTPAVDESCVTWVLPERFVPLHWHGETFSLPAHAVHVAESERCRNQAFEYADGRVVALQFHLEVNPEGLDPLIECSPDELVSGGPGVMTSEELRGRSAAFEGARSLAYLLLDRMAERADAEDARASTA